MEIRKIEAREYKVVLDHRGFADGVRSVKELWDEIAAIASLVGIRYEGEFNQSKARTITFLDTPDLTIRHNRLLLRRRASATTNECEYTLKCRSEDRYIAAGADLRAADGLRPDPKFEEDIAAPFRSRYSSSNSIEFDGDHQVPTDLAGAAALFPLLCKLRRDSMPCSPETPLAPVHGIRAFERVYEGPELRIAEEKRRSRSSSGPTDPTDALAWPNSRSGTRTRTRHTRPRPQWPRKNCSF